MNLQIYALLHYSWLLRSWHAQKDSQVGTWTRNLRRPDMSWLWWLRSSEILHWSTLCWEFQRELDLQKRSSGAIKAPCASNPTLSFHRVIPIFRHLVMPSRLIVYLQQNVTHPKEIDWTGQVPDSHSLLLPWKSRGYRELARHPKQLHLLFHVVPEWSLRGTSTRNLPSRWLASRPYTDFHPAKGPIHAPLTHLWSIWVYLCTYVWS